MIIGIDGSRAFVQGRTGTENYSYQLIRNMSLIDTENRYLIYIKRNQLSEIRRQRWPQNFEFKVISLPRLWTQLGLAFKTFTDPLDVLFIPSHTLPLMRKPGLKTVITVHDLGAEYLPELHQLKQILYLKLMTHYQIKTAAKVISVSEATKQDLIKRIGIKPAKVEVVYEGVDKSLFRKMPNDIFKDIMTKLSLRLRLKYKLEKGEYFLFVGTIQPRKNLQRLITAFSKFLIDLQKDSAGLINPKAGESEIRKSGIPGKSNYQSHSEFSEKHDPAFKLILVGSKGWKSDSIYRLPVELGIEENVRFLGRLTDQELVGLYNGALALTFPSLFEGFGLPILEAFASGCPVITSNTSSMPEVAGDAAILVEPQSQGEIFEAMRKLYDNDILRTEMIDKGLLRLERFDWKIAAKRTIEILERT